VVFVWFLSSPSLCYLRAFLVFFFIERIEFWTSVFFDPSLLRS